MLLAGTLTAIPVALRFGVVEVSTSDVWRALWPTPLASGDAGADLVRSLRLPRALGAWFSGAALGVSGVLLQTVCRNPLASPAMTGASQAAVLGASLALALGGGRVATMCGACIGAFLMARCVLALSGESRRGGYATIVLTGVAAGFFAAAAAGLLRFFTTDEGVAARMSRWLMGGLWQTTFSEVLAAGAVMSAAVLGVVFRPRMLDLLALGSEDARRLGLDDVRLTARCLLCASLAAGAAATLCGLAPFVGLLAPHAARRFFGVGHAAVLPAAAGLGGLLLLAADTLCRTAVSPQELPLGAVTALVGAPLFLVVLRRLRGEVAS